MKTTTFLSFSQVTLCKKRNFIFTKHFKSHTILYQPSQTSKVRGKEIYCFTFYFLKYFYNEVPQASCYFFLFYFMLILDFKYYLCIVYFTLMIMMWSMDMICGWRNMFLKILNEQKIVCYWRKVDINCSFILTIHCCCIPLYDELLRFYGSNL